MTLSHSSYDLSHATLGTNLAALAHGVNVGVCVGIGYLVNKLVLLS